MPNANKIKGDKAELEAVAAFIDLAPDLLVRNPMRMLGAGRAEDVGDLSVLHDAAIQVKAFKRESLSSAMYQAATGATVQARRARMRFAVGLVLVPRARRDAVRFVAVAESWPLSVFELGVEPLPFSAAVTALDAVAKAGVADPFRARVVRKGAVPIMVASLQTWIADYRVAVDLHPPF